MGRLTGVVAVSLLSASSLAFAQPEPVPGHGPGEPPPPGMPPPQAAPPPAPGPSAGGLIAPEPIDPREERTPSETEKRLDAAKEEDSGRGLSWFYLDAEGGFQHVGLETFDVDTSNLTAGLMKTEANGGFVGAGVGLQLFILTVGPRFRAAFFDDFQIFSVGGELGLRFPIGFLEPHFELGGGYAALGSLGGALAGVSDAVAIRGGYGRVSGGLDVYPVKVLSVGLGASWEFMGLARPGLSLDDGDPASRELDDGQRAALAAEGSGFGSAVSIFAKLGLHL
jgi:hypothetical protein